MRALPPTRSSTGPHLNLTWMMPRTPCPPPFPSAGSADSSKNINPNKSNALHSVLFEAIALALHLDTERKLLTSSVAILGRFLSIKVGGGGGCLGVKEGEGGDASASRKGRGRGGCLGIKEGEGEGLDIKAG